MSKDGHHLDNLRRDLESAAEPLEDAKVTVDEVLAEPIHVIENGEQIEVRFTEKPEEDTLQQLKDWGFRWQPEEMCWTAPKESVDAEAVRKTLTGDPISIGARAESIRAGLIQLRRIRSLRSAGEVFSQSSKLAAEQKVIESILAPKSADRQRAQETILGYSIGKPVERIVNLHGQLANATDEELKHDILEQLAELGPELGIKTGPRASRQLLVGAKKREGPDPVITVDSESGRATKVPKKPKARKTRSGWEPERESDTKRD